jgi:hypothetical protein
MRMRVLLVLFARALALLYVPLCDDGRRGPNGGLFGWRPLR